MLEKLTQEQFNHIIDVLILYNKLTPDDVYLNESSIKAAVSESSKPSFAVMIISVVPE